MDEVLPVSFLLRPNFSLVPPLKGVAQGFFIWYPHRALTMN